ncbi:MAG: hypothetical protein MI755_00510, partial [Sphingomonadales bacterium]|nr:hypothetical protein [Sphingomonadales bacterium]
MSHRKCLVSSAALAAALGWSTVSWAQSGESPAPAAAFLQAEDDVDDAVKDEIDDEAEDEIADELDDEI